MVQACLPARTLLEVMVVAGNHICPKSHTPLFPETLKKDSEFVRIEYLQNLKHTLSLLSKFSGPLTFYCPPPLLLFFLYFFIPGPMFLCSSFQHLLCSLHFLSSSFWYILYHFLQYVFQFILYHLLLKPPINVLFFKILLFQRISKFSKHTHIQSRQKSKMNAHGPVALLQ